MIRIECDASLFNHIMNNLDGVVEKLAEKGRGITIIQSSLDVTRYTTPAIVSQHGVETRTSVRESKLYDVIIVVFYYVERREDGIKTPLLDKVLSALKEDLDGTLNAFTQAVNEGLERSKKCRNDDRICTISELERGFLEKIEETGPEHLKDLKYYVQCELLRFISDNKEDFEGRHPLLGITVDIVKKILEDALNNEEVKTRLKKTCGTVYKLQVESVEELLSLVKKVK